MCAPCPALPLVDLSPKVTETVSEVTGRIARDSAEFIALCGAIIFTEKCLDRSQQSSLQSR